MARKKTFQIEYKGEMHKYKVKPPKRSTLLLLQSLDDSDEYEENEENEENEVVIPKKEQEDWGVEALVSSIDGADPLEADEFLQWAVFVEVMDFLGESFKTVTTRKRKRGGKK